ncbi:MAG: tetratricopeptide repeat protein [Thermosynechococcaceae cyanobacterium MS004]|nr:tetratricopeptide repeat protein [Thermosynechococcaceae cyanobacterium MS004]
MQKKSRNWLTIIVLSIASLGFLGATMIPLIAGIINQQSTPSPNASGSPTATAANASENLLKEEEGYQIVLKRNPEDENVLKGLIQTRLQLIQSGLRKPKDVVEPLQQLVKIKPTEPLYASLLAQSQQQAGDFDGAAQTNRNILAQQPTDTTALQGYVEWLIRKQQPTEAQNEVQKAIATAKQANQQQPGSADLPAIELILGDVYLSQRRDAEAIALYDRLQKENPNDFRPVLSKGIVLKNQGKTTEAVTLLKAADAIAPVQMKAKIQELIASAQTPSPSPQSSPPGIVPPGSPSLPSSNPPVPSNNPFVSPTPSPQGVP